MNLYSPVISGRHVSLAVSESWGQAEFSKKSFPGGCNFCMLSPHWHSIDRGHTDICIFVKAYSYFVIWCWPSMVSWSIMDLWNLAQNLARNKVQMYSYTIWSTLNTLDNKCKSFFAFWCTVREGHVGLFFPSENCELYLLSKYSCGWASIPL